MSIIEIGFKNSKINFRKFLLFKTMSDDQVLDDQEPFPRLIHQNSIEKSQKLRHQLEDEMKRIKVIHLAAPIKLTYSQHPNVPGWSQTLKRLSISNPQRTVDFAPIHRYLTNKHADIYTKRNRLKNKFKVPFFFVAFQLAQNVIFHNFITFLLFFQIFSTIFLTSAEESLYPILFQILNLFNYFCSTMYIIDITLHMIGRGKHFFSDFWFDFDLICLLFSLIPPSLIIAIAVELNADVYRISEKIKFFDVLQAIRIFRIIPRINQLRNITEALGRASKKMFSIIIFILIFMYVFALLGMYLFSDFTNYQGPIQFELQYKFSSFSNALITTFQLITFDTWFSQLQEIIQVCNPFFVYLYFLSWVWLGAFILSNIFVGVMVYQLNVENELEKERIENEKKIKWKVNSKTIIKQSNIMHKFNAAMQLAGNETIAKIDALFRKMEPFNLNMNSLSSDENLQKKMLFRNLSKIGKDSEIEWTNEELSRYFSILSQISDHIYELEELEQQYKDIIHLCLKNK